MDNRIYNLKRLNNRLGTLEKSKPYQLKAIYANHDTAEVEKANITIAWLKLMRDHNNTSGDLCRFRIYDGSNCLVSFNVSVLDKAALYEDDYNQDLRKFARPDRHAEKKLARTQILLTPTLKSKLKLRASLQGLSMNQAINQLVEAYVSKL